MTQSTAVAPVEPQDNLPVIYHPRRNKDQPTALEGVVLGYEPIRPRSVSASP